MALLEDEDGAPYPEVLAISDPSCPLWLPHRPSDEDYTRRYVAANEHLGWKAVGCQIVPVKDDGP